MYFYLWLIYTFFLLSVSAEDKPDNGELDLEGIDEDEIEKVCV